MASNNSSDFDDDYGKRPPFFNGEKYYYWKNRMKAFVGAFDFDALSAIEEGPFVPTHKVNGLTIEKPEDLWTDDDKKKVHHDSRAKHWIFCALSNDVLSFVMYCETAQEMWNTLRDIYEGTGEVKRAKIGRLTGEYERFHMKHGEKISDMEMRFYDVVHHLASLGKEISDEDLVNKVLRCLSRKWQRKVRTIVKSRNFSMMKLGLLFRELEEHEIEMNRLEENDEMHKNKTNRSTSRS